jgi:hypothetical protein
VHVVVVDEWSRYGNFTPTCKGALTGVDNAIGYPYHQHRPLVLTEMGLITSAYPHNANEAEYTALRSPTRCCSMQSCPLPLLSSHYVHSSLTLHPSPSRLLSPSLPLLSVAALHGLSTVFPQ